MKISILLLMIGTMQMMASPGYSQRAELSFEMENVAVKDVLEEIESNSEFFFLYSSKMVNLDRKVSIQARNDKIDQILAELFHGENIKPYIIDRQIILSPESLNKEEITEKIKQQQQQHEVSGTLTDAQTGDPLPGVNIVVQGTTTGTTTDMDGEYTLEAPADATLAFSFVGYQEQTVEIDGREEINVSMQQAVTELEEVVAVGYGRQKKINLTGSVAAIGSEDIANKAVSKASQSLAGELSGVTVQQGSGNPTNDEATIRIRGLGTFSGAGNEPLVLIDGMAGSIDDVNPNDIEDISVLKDAASASIYGARAANGVILIETKRGKEGDLTVNYDGYFGWQKPTELIQYVDSWTYAEMENEAMLNEGKNIRYTQEEIEKFKSGEDPDNYPNARRYKQLLNTGNPLQTDHNLRISGGTAQNRYSFSAGYLQKNGLVNYNSYEQYKMRLNLDSKISEKLDLSLNLSGHHSIDNDKASHLLGLAIKLPPTLPARKSDGTYGHIGNQEVFGTYDSESFDRDKENYFSGNFNLDYNILESLTIRGRAGYRNTAFHDRSFDAEIVLDENYTKGPSDLSVSRGNSTFLTLESIIEYNQTFQDHEITLLGGYSQEESIYEYDWAYRDNFPNNLLYQINAGSEENMRNSGSMSEWGLQSVFGRFRYSYQGKYLFEANARYDGSSRFPERNRYDFFPSFSAGWNISEENFFNVSWIDNFKLRGSWGTLGNQRIGRYPYQQTLNLGYIYPFGGQVTPGAAANTLPNRDITWEITKVTDIGLDLTLWEGKLSLVTDYFNKKTEKILYNISTSSVLGLTPSEQNAGVVENNGWEFQIIHKNTIGDFSYSISPNFSVVHNEVKSIAQTKRDIDQGLFVGEPLESIYGYVADGLFVDESDIQNYPEQPYEAKPGYIRLKDISGPNGEPDGKVTPEYDRKVIGNEFPKYNFGGKVSVNYKDFDFSIQVQGLGGTDDIVLGNRGLAFMEGSPPQKWMIENRWTKEDPDPNAKYPRIERVSEGHPHTYPSTYFLRDATFLRIKNLQLGYSLPSVLTNNLNMNQVRVYFNASNLITFDNYYEGWDPEMSGEYYPPTTVYNFGLNVSF